MADYRAIARASADDSSNILPSPTLNNAHYGTFAYMELPSQTRTVAVECIQALYLSYLSFGQFVPTGWLALRDATGSMDISPHPAFGYGAYVRRTDSELHGQFTGSQGVTSVQFPNSKDITFGQFCHRMPAALKLTVNTATLFVHVLDIIKVGSQEEMTWVDASTICNIISRIPIIARMTDAQAIRYFPVMQYIRKPMGQKYLASPAFIQCAITRFHDACCPKPTGIRVFGLVNLSPKTVNGWDKSARQESPSQRVAHTSSRWLNTSIITQSARCVND